MLRALRGPALAVALTVTAVLLPGTALAQSAPDDSRYFVPAPPSSAELGSQVDQQAALLAAQEAELAAAAQKANAALEVFQAARRAAEAAAREAAAEAERLAAAQRATAAAQERLAGYIGSLYRTGMGNSQLSLYSSLLDSRNPQQLFTGLSMAQRVGGNTNNAFVALSAAEAAQAAAAERSAAAERQQREAEARATELKTAADVVVAQQQDLVKAREIALLRTQAAAAAAAAQEQERAALLARAEEIARQRSEAPIAAIEGAFVDRPTAACKGQDTSGYPNGRIPADALCPLWGTSGQMLRADAAAAFNEMSRSYAQVFGAPICVTDSYRSYEEQVAVKAAKPGLAAQPGSSNHGWGMAVDLCDGVQQFGTPTHQWLRDHSMLYGFFLPAWAQQGGSKPEPWHWEFAG